MEERIGVDLDDRSAKALVKLLGMHVEEIEYDPSLRAVWERTWVAWMVLCLAPADLQLEKLRDVSKLIEELRGLISPARFEEATGSRRSNLPSSWASVLPPSLSGKLASSPRPAGTSDPSGDLTRS